MSVFQEALTFDDVLLTPRHSLVLPRDVDLKTQLTRNIRPLRWRRKVALASFIKTYP